MRAPAFAGKRARVSKIEMTRNVFRNNRPFVVEDAPTVASGICGNRQVNKTTEHAYVSRERGTGRYAPCTLVLDDGSEVSGLALKEAVDKLKAKLAKAA